MRRLALALLVLAGLMPGAAKAAKDELVIGMTQFPSTFHPSFDPMMAKSYVLGMTQRPFTAYDPEWKLVCMLCTELPTIENGRAVIEPLPGGGKGIALTYTIHPDATWGDGTPVTTDDVLFTYEVGSHPKSGVGAAEMYRQITRIDVQDEKTFTLHVDRVSFEYNSIGDFRVLPAHLDREIFEAHPIAYRNRTTFDTNTTEPGLYFGPYRITEVSDGAFVVLEPNPTWWGDEPHFKRIVVKVIENTAALEANLLSGGIDMIAGELGPTIDQALAFEKRHGADYQMVYQPGLFYEHIDFNLDNPILADERVRKALIMGLDREALSQQLFEGRQPVAHTSVNPLDWVYAEDVPHYAEDLEAATALLDEAGWSDMHGGVRHNAKGQPLSLDLVTTADNRTRELVAQVLQSQWRRLGIDVRIRSEPPRVLFGETLTRRQFEGMAMYAWISSPENVPRTTLHSEEIPTAENGWSRQNHPGFRSAEMDQLLEAIEVELDRNKRKKMWHRLQEIYAEELPVLPLYFRSEVHIWPPWLEGVTPTGHLNPSTLWVEEWRARKEA